MAGHFFSTRSHFAAKQANKAKTTKAAIANSGTHVHEPEVAQFQHEEAKTIAPKPAESMAGNAKNTSGGDYEARIVSLNDRIAQLKEQLKIPKFNKKTPKLKNGHQKSQARANEATEVSKRLMERQERFNEFRDKVNEKKRLEHQRYSRVGFQLQLFAEWTLTPRQRQRYRHELDKVNEKRRAEGKTPK